MTSLEARRATTGLRVAGRTTTGLRVAWAVVIAAAAAPRVWNALFGPLFYAYDDWAHVSYIFFLDTYHALPYADQGWSYFHPPLYYAVGWLFARLGDAESLVRGLALFGSAASLGTAGLAAWLVRRVLPEPPWLSPLAFAALALLPVQVFTSGMIGNEMLACLLGSAALFAAVVNEERETPRLREDLLTGTLAGLAALTKFSGLTMGAGIGAAIVVHHFLAHGRGDLGSLFRRCAVIAGVAALIAGPFYVRNTIEYGNPVQFSNEFSPMVEVEGLQPPGERGLVDFLHVSPRLFSDPALNAPHLIHSVWGSLYLNLWFDTSGASQIPVEGWDSREPRKLALTRLFAALGVVPTLLAGFGLLVCVRSYVARRRFSDLVMPLLTGLCLASFVLFAIRVPSWAALKASYLMTLSIPYAFFVARAVLALHARSPALAALACVPVALAAAACALVFTSGLVLEERVDKRELAAVHLLFGDAEKARAGWAREVRDHPNSQIAADGLGATLLLAGRPDAARPLYRRTLRRPIADHPYRANRLAVAAALAGDREAALKLLLAATSERQPVELLVNRAALRASLGRLELAERDLLNVLERAPHLAPALQNLAFVSEQLGRDATALRERAEAARWQPPRGFPYGVGNGDVRRVGGNQRFLLIVDEAGLQLYRPPRARL